MQDAKTIISALKRIERETRELLEQLESQPTAKPVGVCLWCGKPLLSTDRVRRGTHENSCYGFIMRRIKDGELVEEELVANGRLAPKKPAGRKRLTPTEHRTQAAEEREKYKTKRKDKL